MTVYSGLEENDMRKIELRHGSGNLDTKEEDDRKTTEDKPDEFNIEKEMRDLGFHEDDDLVKESAPSHIIIGDVGSVDQDWGMKALGLDNKKNLYGNLKMTPFIKRNNLSTSNLGIRPPVVG